MSQHELQDRLNDLHSILSIDHRNTSSFLRTKTSATDNRPSSVSIGITKISKVVDKAVNQRTDNTVSVLSTKCTEKIEEQEPN
jgi:hypothetical protein